MYTGFFKYNIERWLSSDIVYKVFKLLGYERTSIDTLTLEARDYENRVSAMGFELFLAHTQLYVLKSDEYLSPKYSMENILEGWLNTSGSGETIRDWLATNRSTITEKSDFKSSPSHTNVTGEAMRSWSKSVTIEPEPLHYDEHGYTMVKHSVKHPPNSSRQHDSSASSGFPSLRTSNFSDCQLYGDSDHSVSPPPRSGSKSDYSDESAMVRKPLSFTNKLHEFEHGCEFEKRKDATHPKEYVVSRGGNSISENSRLNENIGNGVTYIQAGKERVGEIFALRKKHYKQSLQNRDYESRKIGNDFTTSTGMFGEEVKFEDDLENRSTDGIQPSPIILLNSSAPSNPTNNFGEMGSSFSCYVCNKPPAYGCVVCDKLLCEECFKSTQKPPCCENADKFYSVI